MNKPQTGLARCSGSDETPCYFRQVDYIMNVTIRFTTEA
jgi:hypothetical protein